MLGILPLTLLFVIAVYIVVHFGNQFIRFLVWLNGYFFNNRPDDRPDVRQLTLRQYWLLIIIIFVLIANYISIKLISNATNSVKNMELKFKEQELDLANKNLILAANKLRFKEFELDLKNLKALADIKYKELELKYKEQQFDLRATNTLFESNKLFAEINYKKLIQVFQSFGETSNIIFSGSVNKWDATFPNEEFFNLKKGQYLVEITGSNPKLFGNFFIETKLISNEWIPATVDNFIRHNENHVFGDKHIVTTGDSLTSTYLLDVKDDTQVFRINIRKRNGVDIDTNFHGLNLKATMLFDKSALLLTNE
jgi:hypothetical protein